MVNNKKVERHLTFYMSKMGEPQTSISKDLSLLKGQGNFSSSPEPRVTHLSKQGFPDRVYLLASVIFQNNHLEKPAAQRLINYSKDGGLPLPEVGDEEMQQAAYELAFNTLKYQELLEEVMINSRFHLTQPVPADQTSIVAVMLYDFQDREFPKRERQRNGEIIQEVRNVESLLLRCKTKLEAAFAGCKIKHNHCFIENFLPEIVQKKQKMSVKLPLYAWVNTLKCSLDEVQSVLRDAGFLQVKSIKQLGGKTFFQDPHCGDTVVFPAQLKAQLYSTKLLCDHKLILQDKSCSLGPNAACSLLPESGDVLMVGCFSGLTVSHMASLIVQKQKADLKHHSMVYVCVNDCTDAQKEKLQHTVSIMGCKNVKLMQKDFQSLDRGDKRLQKVRVILLIPRCSVSAVSNPVEFILQENGDTDLLQDLSHGSIAQSKLESLVAQQRKDIDHALKFPMNLAVVYSTCSSYPEENVDVVNTALQKAKDRSDQERQRKTANFRPSPSPFSSLDHGEETEPFFVLEPTEHSNGCFLAVLNRQPDPVIQEAPQDVIARANATGILAGIGSNQKKPHRSSNRMKETAQAHCSQPHVSVCMQSRKQQIMSSNGRRDFHQPSKGKPRPLCLQTPLRSFTYSKPERRASSSFKTKKITPTKLTSTTVDSSTSSAPNSAVVPPSPLAPVIHPRRSQAEVQKPMVLVLPIINFPGSFMPQHNPVGFGYSPGHNRWKSAAQFLSQRPCKNPVEKLQPLYGPFKH